MTSQLHDVPVPPTDARARALYLEAQAQMSAGTIARLNRARHAALSAAPVQRRGWAWPLAAGCTALLALAAGLQISAPPGAAPPAWVGAFLRADRSTAPGLEKGRCWVMAPIVANQARPSETASSQSSSRTAGCAACSMR